MPTLKKYFNPTAKRTVTQEDFRDNILDYLIESDKSLTALQFPRDGVVGISKVVLEQNGVNDQFRFAGTWHATDGVGNHLEVTDTDFRGKYFYDIPFDNNISSKYDVALHYARIPSGIKINSRTGQPDFDSWQDTIGLSGDPNTVVDNGNGTITLGVSNMLDNTMDNTGRYVVVWKDTPGPNGVLESVAIEELQVDSSNEVTTVGEFGQSTVSTTLSDYTAVVMGPCVYEDLPGLITQDEYTYIGEITGNGPAAVPVTFDTSNQRLFDATSGFFSDITRLEATSDMYKVSVLATSLDVATNQIEVKDPGLVTVFSVDGLGDALLNSLSFSNSTDGHVALELLGTGGGGGLVQKFINDDGSAQPAAATRLGELAFYGRDNDSVEIGASLVVQSTGGWGASDRATEFVFNTVESGTTVLNPRMKITATGAVQILSGNQFDCKGEAFFNNGSSRSMQVLSSNGFYSATFSNSGDGVPIHAESTGGGAAIRLDPTLEPTAGLNDGELYFDSVTKQLRGYNGSVWETISPTWVSAEAGNSGASILQNSNFTSIAQDTGTDTVTLTMTKGFGDGDYCAVISGNDNANYTYHAEKSDGDTILVRAYDADAGGSPLDLATFDISFSIIVYGDNPVQV